ncbi:N-carbamoyl-L-amino-acid hydrolase [Saccharopolyspora antimicrobica]|uniref:N-carbamoyl-L-amino-acid hydrolase n=1 Tax=Saccharopolyspora antimicrobica TaxID=455193 RepID=A0A1I5CBZ4_9PSEU|nr:M20 family metallo-hydrolase [Saccharopolyspora antimicrobica]RKT88906.1 N-carbamoyl-L-amino-acid hydrolase [Saccharopolyspora antimicrobica]SFN84483.1 N-carbamoyl-L-amino-acid hydrolase [Saccharopolyspora antimicrobica]
MSTEAFLTDFHQVAAIGATPAGGVERQAATPEDKQLRDWFTAFAAERGWPVRVDSIGNLFALVEWRPGADYVLVGSHLDSQPLGGRFDGAYGVIAALHAADRLAARVAGGEPPKYNLAVVDWFNEEGSRFAPSIMGSSVFAGLMDEQEMLRVTDPDGITVAEALDAIGYRGTDERPKPAAYAEIHIEQGPVLEREGIALGAVDRSWYTQKLDVEVLGEQSHTGATAMADRRDALVAASKVVVLVHDVTADFEPESIVSSVGYLTLEPNSPIVVPRRVHLVADIRANAPEIVQQARELLLERIAAVAREHDLTIEVRDFDVRPVQHFPEQGLEIAEKVAADLGAGIRRINTMAGHDSVAMNRIVPALMLFIPSIDGVSHCEREYTSDDQMAIGVDALTEATWELLQGGLEAER